MGINVHALEFLLQSRAMGVEFGNLLTLGRHSLQVRKRGKWPWSRFRNISPDALALMQKSVQPDGYSETLLRNLGAAQVTSIDFSDYEKADLVHDFNTPIGADMHERFDTVLDCGSLEHIFNVPTALQNLMQITRVGGHLMLLTTATGFCGHGFYQFSPEFFFRALGAENGFQVLMVGLIDTTTSPSIHVLDDPAITHHRIEYQIGVPTYIVAIAQRISNNTLFKSAPSQSLYETSWGEKETPDKPTVQKRLYAGIASSR